MLVAMPKLGLRGIVASIRNDELTNITGAKMNPSLSASLGVMISFTNSFMPSAMFWSQPPIL